MQQRCLMMAIVLSIIVALLPVSGWALFDQADLEGTWSTEVWGGSPSGVQCWEQCTLTIGPDGTIQAAGTYIDCFGANSDITGGQLVVSSDGGIQGTIVTSSGSVDVGPGGIIGDKLVLGADM